MSVEVEKQKPEFEISEEDPGKDIEEAYNALEELRKTIKALRGPEARP